MIKYMVYSKFKSVILIDLNQYIMEIIIKNLVSLYNINKTADSILKIPIYFIIMLCLRINFIGIKGFIKIHNN